MHDVEVGANGIIFEFDIERQHEEIYWNFAITAQFSFEFLFIKICDCPLFFHTYTNPYTFTDKNSTQKQKIRRFHTALICCFFFFSSLAHPPKKKRRGKKTTRKETNNFCERMEICSIHSVGYNEIGLSKQHVKYTMNKERTNEKKIPLKHLLNIYTLRSAHKTVKLHFIFAGIWFLRIFSQELKHFAFHPEFLLSHLKIDNLCFFLQFSSTKKKKKQQIATIIN